MKSKNVARLHALEQQLDGDVQALINEFWDRVLGPETWEAESLFSEAMRAASNSIDQIDTSCMSQADRATIERILHRADYVEREMTEAHLPKLWAGEVSKVFRK